MLSFSQVLVNQSKTKIFIDPRITGKLVKNPLNYLKQHRPYLNETSRHFIHEIKTEDITRRREDMNFIFEWQNNILRTRAKYCFCHEKIEFISSSCRVMFFLLYRQNDIDRIIEGNYQNYVIDKLTCEIMDNKPLGSRMQFL